MELDGRKDEIAQMLIYLCQNWMDWIGNDVKIGWFCFNSSKNAAHSSAVLHRFSDNDLIPPAKEIKKIVGRILSYMDFRDVTKIIFLEIKDKMRFNLGRDRTSALLEVDMIL